MDEAHVGLACVTADAILGVRIYGPDVSGIGSEVEVSAFNEVARRARCIRILCVPDRVASVALMEIGDVG